MTIVERVDNFYLTDEEVAASPSRREGLDEETEFKLRLYGCELVQESTVLLRATQAVACTGQVLLHRFYAKQPLTKFNVKRVAATSVFLACKLEENPRKLRDVVNVFHRMVRRREGKSLDLMEYFSQRYEDEKQDLIRTERHMLREFGFCIHVEHPHKFVLNYLRMMEQSHEMMQCAWSFANDSLRTTLCVRWKADAVAVACIYLAARTLGIALPDDPPWYSLFDVSLQDIEVICESVLALYECLPPGSGTRATYIPVGKFAMAPSSPAWRQPATVTAAASPLGAGRGGMKAGGDIGVGTGEGAAAAPEKKWSGGTAAELSRGPAPAVASSREASSREGRDGGGERDRRSVYDVSGYKRRKRSRSPGWERSRRRDEERRNGNKERDRSRDRGRSRDRSRERGRNRDHVGDRRR